MANYRNTCARRPNAISGRKRLQPRRRQSKSSSLLGALVIEGLAVGAILFLFFGMQADLKNQSQARILAERKSNLSAASFQTTTFDFAESFASSVQDHW